MFPDAISMRYECHDWLASFPAFLLMPLPPLSIQRVINKEPLQQVPLSYGCLRLDLHS